MSKQYTLIDSVFKFSAFLSSVRAADVVAVDTETTGLNPRKDRIIGWSVSLKEGSGYYFPLEFWSSEKLHFKDLGPYCAKDVSRRFFRELLPKKLVFHNASFDVEFIHNYLGVDLLDSVWVDTQVLVHTVLETGVPNSPKSFGLKELAIYHQRDIGLEDVGNLEQLALQESVKKNGGRPGEVWKADLDVLWPYACADTDLTLRLCHFYLARLESEGLSQLFFEDEVMPLFREVTMPMSRRGIKLDVPLMEATDRELVAEIASAKSLVLKALFSDKRVVRWAYDKSSESFPASTRGRYAQKLCELSGLNLPKKAFSYDVSKKSIETYASMVAMGWESRDAFGALTFLRSGRPEDLDKKMRARVSLALWKDKHDGDYLNLSSKKQLSEVVFDYLKVSPPVESRALKNGRPQFNEALVKELARAFEWAKHLRIYNKLLKIKSTYVDRYLSKAEDGYFYPFYRQHGTITGRYSSDIQQLPRPVSGDEPLIVSFTNRVRAFFIAGEGRSIIDADYESLEPHCFAFVSGDDKLLEIFRKGWDFYSTIAIDSEGLTGFSKNKSDPKYLGAINKPLRQRAKGYALGIAYGMGAHALHKHLNLTKAEGHRILKGYLESYPQLAEWIKRSRQEVKAKGTIKNYLGRVRHLPEVKALYDRYGDSLLSVKFRRTMKLAPEKIDRYMRLYKNGLNNATNYQIQSLASGLVNRAAIAVNRRAKELGIDAYVQCQVHDQLIVNCASEKVHIFAPEVQRLMETTTELPGIQLKAPPEITDNFRDGH